MHWVYAEKQKTSELLQLEDEQDKILKKLLAHNNKMVSFLYPAMTSLF